MVQWSLCYYILMMKMIQILAFGFRNDGRTVPGFEMALFRTTGGPLDSAFSVDDTISTNLHVFGDIYTSNAVGVANILPTHDLCVGSNLFVEDTGSNVLEVFGNTYTQKVKSWFKCYCW